MSAEVPRVLLAIRLRSGVKMGGEMEYALRTLRLGRRFHAVLVPNKPEFVGMLRKVKDLVTWGEPSPERLALLLERRGRITGAGRLDGEALKRLGYGSIEEIARGILEGRISPKELYGRGLKPVFRLHPPKGGFKGSIKKPYGSGGELGYRGRQIDELIEKMS
ncbi:MAG: 50S ribosomal protein L30 [Candidatus Bathyarchaeia archaeon]